MASKKGKETSRGPNAYDPDKLKTEALRIAEEEDCCFIEDVVSLMECSRKTFYNHELHNLHELKEIIARNKVSKKRMLRKNWETGHQTTQLALYKLLATPDELNRLSQQKHEISGPGGGPIETSKRQITAEQLKKLPLETRKAILELMKNGESEDGGDNS